MTAMTENGISALDSTIDRMREHLPSQPYIQTIPQDAPRFQHYSRELGEMWLHNAPFDRSEHPDSQYQTWFYHEHGSDLIHLRVHSQVKDKEAKSASIIGTPIDPKKKISLAAYKDKKGSDSIRKAEQDHDPEQKKRKRPETNGQSPASHKKTKTSPVKPSHTSPLPPLLSPLDPPRASPLPARLSPLGVPLPSRLSPTLPPKIMNALRERERRAAAKELSEVQHDSFLSERQMVRIVRLKIPKRLRQDFRRLVHLDPAPRPADAVGGVGEMRGPRTPPPPVTQKTHITPARKDIRAVTKRGESVDGVTPVPSATPAASTTKPSPASSTAKTTLSQAWWEERDRLAALGKKLKRTASEHDAASKAGQEGQGEVAALVWVESFVSFILSFYCSDRSYAARNPPIHHPDAKGTWCSLVPYFKMVQRATTSYPALHGLMSLIGMAYHARVVAWLVQSRHAGPEREDALVMMYRLAEGSSLSVSMLKADFPETMAKGTLGAEEDVRPGHYDGPLELALGMQTGPLQAVRIAYSILQEWKCAKYSMTLTLDGKAG